MKRTVAAACLVASLALSLSGCANVPAGVAVPTLACAEGQQAMLSDWLYFGMPMPEGDGGRDVWGEFISDVVLPRFPDGLTMWPAQGQWKPAQGATVHEMSWVLNVVHVPDARSEAAIGTVVDVYKKIFHQESVLRVTSAVCAAF